MPKTALMGSPLAVIGTVFRHRRTLAKTGAAVGGVLMLPILFLVMLPGLVFGDLSENTGALTSNTVISENIRASNQAIVEVLQESHDALLAKINAEIARLPEGDTASISDPYLSLDVSCTKREQTLFGKNQQYWFASDNGKEYAFSLEKNIKLLEGHRYRLYFRKPQQGTGQSMPCAGDILGYEELTDQLPELPDTSV